MAINDWHDFNAKQGEIISVRKDNKIADWIKL